ncbi:MAG: hypothetical protein JJE51_06995, partial [Thermoanaerobaculia bacterium]|nr:hypothetical protein [Thermoanaerobaculia bacterium]
MKSFSVILLAIVATSAAGATNVTLQREGAAVEGEVCRFAALDRENPFERWLASSEVVCVSAAAAVEFPKGLWNVFGRSGDQLLSAPVFIDGGAAPSTTSLTMMPAAGLNPSLPRNRRAIVYVPRRALAYPVAGRTAVPPDEPLWLIVLDGAKVVAVHPVAPLEAGSSRNIEVPFVSPNTLLAWIKVQDTGAVNVPRVHVKIGDDDLESDPLPPADTMDGALIRVAGVEAGDAALALDGRDWIADRRRVRIQPGVTTVDAPLVARGAASVVIRWSTSSDLPLLERSIGACEPADEVRGAELTLLRCAAACSVVRSETYPIDARRGDLSVAGLAAGQHRAELRFGKLPAVSAETTLAVFQQRTISVFADYRELGGALTRGGKPVERKSTVRIGSIAAGLAQEGEYRAVASRMIPAESEITIASCDGTLRATLLTDAPIPPDVRYDIDIPANELLIEVIDTFTRLPIGGATVQYTALSRLAPKRAVLTRSFTVAADTARFSIGSIPTREIQLVVGHPEYEKKHLAPFTMEESGTKTIEVQLMPLRGDRGRVTSARVFENAVIVWFSASGRQTERAELAADGVFVSTGGHGVDESMTIVSSSHPLWTTRAPQLDPRRPIDIRFPDEVLVREFEVSMKGADLRDARYFGLMVGGVRVPLPALRMHAEMRRFSPTVKGSAMTRVRDIAESGPIEIRLGPRVERVRGFGEDPFASPPFGLAPGVRLGPDVTWI